MGFVTKAVVTDAGLNLLGRIHASDNFVITRAVMGEGSLGSGQRPGALTAVIAPVMEAQLISVSPPFQGRVTLRFDARPGDVPRDFYWRELGIYVRDIVNNVELLYIYNNAGATADYIHAGTADIKSISLPVIIGNAANVEATIDETIAYALQADMAAHVNDKGNPHVVTAAQVGAATAAQGAKADAAAPLTSLNAHVNNMNNPHGASPAQIGAATAAQGAKADAAAPQSSLTAHINDKGNPHGATPAQIGAATAAQGAKADAAAPQSSLNAHLNNMSNPHGVNLAQIGAAAASALSSHTGNTNNPHGTNRGHLRFFVAGSLPGSATEGDIYFVPLSSV